jgi:putative heme-binding domain-containing protein
MPLAQHLPLAGLVLALAALLTGCSQKPPPAPPVPAGPPPATVVTNLQIELPKRRAALRELLKTEPGAQQVLRFARGGLLPPDLRLAAGLEMTHLGWPEVAMDAAQVLQPPFGVDNRPLPRFTELVARRGDPAKGTQVFRRPAVNCIGCHLVRGEGVRLGSDLSDIALRMDRESLWENILDPSAVVTKGYETWQIILNNEDEYVGVLVVETATDLSLRDAKNNLTVIKKSDLKIRRQLQVSIMPTGLQQGMTVEDMADLIEYLLTLKTPPPGQ